MGILLVAGINGAHMINFCLKLNHNYYLTWRNTYTRFIFPKIGPRKKRNGSQEGGLMTTDVTLSDRIRKICGYFSLKELGIILSLSILAVITGTILPGILVAGGKGYMPALMHGILKFPSPSAGFIVFGGVLCFWLVLALLLVRKPWTAISVSLLIIVMDAIICQQPCPVAPTNIESLSALLIVAVIIELLALLSWEKTPLRYLMTILFVVLGAALAVVYFTGDNRIGYVLIAFLAFCYAYICYRYPLKFLAAAALASIYYMVHFWVFFHESNKTFALPLSPGLLLVHLTIVAVGGALFATLAYGVDRLVNIYRGHDV